MATRRVATVFGGSGFIGRYIVQRLAAAGYVVRVAVRNTDRALFLKPMGAVGQIVPLRASLSDAAGVTRAIDGAEIAINLVGILAERTPGDFARVHGEGAGRVASIAAAAGVAKLLQISAIGASAGSPSLYARSKAAGEAAVTAAFPHALILRPSLVFGLEDQFFNRFAGMARMLPVMPVMSGNTRFQPVYVADVADAVMAALALPETAPRIYELGGPAIWTFRELMAWILQETHHRRMLVEVPMGLARLQAKILEKLPGKLLTQDQLLLLAQDNVVGEGVPALDALGISPKSIELVVPQYLARFRAGGGKAQPPAM